MLARRHHGHPAALGMAGVNLLLNRHWKTGAIPASCH
jgi:hypothetical protein